MLDLDLLRTGGTFSTESPAATRLVLFNQTNRVGPPGVPRNLFETHFRASACSASRRHCATTRRATRISNSR